MPSNQKKILIYFILYLIVFFSLQSHLRHSVKFILLIHYLSLCQILACKIKMEIKKILHEYSFFSYHLLKKGRVHVYSSKLEKFRKYREENK